MCIGERFFCLLFVFHFRSHGGEEREASSAFTLLFDFNEYFCMYLDAFITLWDT